MTTKTYDRQTAKFIATVCQNLPEISADVMQGWIENPKTLQKVLLNALCPPETTSELKAWKTIKLGTGLQTADDFRRALKDGGFRIGDRGNDILGKSAFTMATEETEVDLVVVSVAELGFETGAYCEGIYKRAQELELELCPPEVGPQLRLQYKDQPMGECLLIGMEPISDSDSHYPNVFSVEHDSGSLWLCSSLGHSGHFRTGGDRWVFLHRDK